MYLRPPPTAIHDQKLAYHPTMKVKRVADHQISKEEYDVDERDVEAPDPGRGMSRASDDVMKRRKIVKVSG